MDRINRVNRKRLSIEYFKMHIKKQKARHKDGLFRIWLGYQDSNLGMPRSKPGALPLGDTPNKLL